MPKTRSGASYKPSNSSQKGHGHYYGSRQSDTKGQGSDTATRSLSGHIQSQPEGLQQCTAAQRVPDLCRSVEKLHELIPDCKKVPRSSQHLQVTQWMASIDGKKKNMMLLTAEWSKNNPPQPKQVPRPAPVTSISNSNVKKQPQAQNKGKGKAPAPKPYGQGYSIPNIGKDAMENVFQMAEP
ncbi:hypothetical protein O181_129947 [Austropuccinia psidii MF-1]|uniref:Uncharacterized protein n=1 Tax=Austropuccinia psidii MF-1 TaxID=1389203 RepID=A0A9Q3L079_9BASI|nr:hypothetical protein [Austropuccinia psidii MF-1]